METTDCIFERTTSNRLLVADVLESLRPEQWREPTLCAGWDVRHLAAHFVQPMLVGFGRFFLASIRHRGNTAATVAHFTRSLAQREPDELIRLLREHAADRVDPPRVGPMGPFADTCVHLRDIARPLALAADVPVEHWVMLLDHLMSGSAAPALIRSGMTDGVALRATDADWAAGQGADVSGQAEALAMTLTGRAVALDDLRGPGVGVLRERVS